MSDRRGLLIILSSPSGAGKSTLSQRLLHWDPTLSFSVSATTRAPRAGEEDGRDYHFLSEAEFKRQVAEGGMLEHAHVFGNFYGSPRGPVQASIDAGRDVLFDIDWQGAHQLQEKMPADVVSIFVLPPTMGELMARLHRRAEDDEETIQKRLKNAAHEIGQWRSYDYVIVNDDLNRAFGAVQAIVKAERLRRDRRPGLFDFVDGLLNETI